jgi:hypothetical protein
MLLIDLAEMPLFNPAAQNTARGDWSLYDVTLMGVVESARDKVSCVDHGAMNCVNPERSIWRCLTCGRAAYDWDRRQT